MRIKKVRGHRRLQRKIDHYFAEILSEPLDFNGTGDYDYVKFNIWPWSGITYNRASKPAEPKKQTRQKIIKGFLDVYEHWKSNLKQFNESYDLVLWLYVPAISKSQVVFSTRTRVDFYKHTFYTPDTAPKFNLSNTNDLADRLKKMKWEYAFDEEHYDEDTVGDASAYSSLADYNDHKKWFNRQMKKPYRVTKLNQTEYYSFRVGDVWVGR